MVSKAREDLPEPLRPVMTVKVLRGISTEMFFKLCWRAPRTVMLLIAMNLINLVRRAYVQPQQNKRNRYQKAPEGMYTALLRILSSCAWDGQFVRFGGSQLGALT